MINLTKFVMVHIGVSAVLDIAEKIHNWGRDKKNARDAQSRTRSLN